MLRRGPRPLPFHLGLSTMRAMAATLSLPQGERAKQPCWSASPPWNSAWPLSKSGQAEAKRIAQALSATGQPPEALAAAVRRRLVAEHGALLAGIRAYRAAEIPAALEPMPCLWHAGSSRVTDYVGAGPTALFVPSLINRAHILDLAPGQSMLRHLAGQGMRPLLLDWGVPGDAERGFTLTDYTLRLAAALEALPGPVVLVGYCMGGLIALAAAQHRPERVAALALLATPWDFAATLAAGQATARLLALLEPILALEDVLPVDAIQLLFAVNEPFGVGEKYRAFAGLDPRTPRAAAFVAMEDWLNDGVPLAAAVARECLGGWYGENTPMRGLWRVAGQAVRPQDWRGPAFLAIPHRDRIVPPASALALASLMPGATVHEAAAGHVGMVAGTKAEAALWTPLAEWIAGLHPLPL
ncbi:alpha/beta fold hydrolase [Plastoroseomonas arctica]|uniref:Alpha/beta hydrolase n=1 Tax=Plastoroseomonas arctica TaxID=1509237 RepID=A0AAF1KMK1_9PROT|nr:alpha/beta fold hydrolase [Plastoroseomonas arctica]MBR0655664.1 alpha/beta hydrolase [Plastoroseomonas arctica]